MANPGGGTPRVDAMIAGTQKGGTTSLLRYLTDLPGVVGPNRFEFPYFTVDEYHDRGIEAAFDRWLPDHDPSTGGRLVLVKSVGVMHLPVARDRLHAHNPDCRIIVCLREPVARAHSAYWYLRRTGQENLPTFEAAIEAEPERLADFEANHHFGYVDRGRYHDQVAELVRLFGRDRVLLLASEELRREPLEQVRVAARFLGLEPPTELAEGPRNLNPAGAVRSPGLARLVRGQTANPVLAGVRALVDRNRLVRVGLSRAVGTLNRRSGFAQPPLAEATRAELARRFEASNRALADEFGFAPAAWTGRT